MVRAHLRFAKARGKSASVIVLDPKNAFYGVARAFRLHAPQRLAFGLPEAPLRGRGPACPH
eukprot:14814301-Alexandrium_andersonii.AAC.1